MSTAEGMLLWSISNIAIISDDYAGDPYGHVTNECGHTVLGIALASVAAFAGLWWPIPLAAADNPRTGQPHAV